MTYKFAIVAAYSDRTEDELKLIDASQHDFNAGTRQMAENMLAGYDEDRARNDGLLWCIHDSFAFSPMGLLLAAQLFKRVIAFEFRKVADAKITVLDNGKRAYDFSAFEAFELVDEISKNGMSREALKCASGFFEKAEAILSEHLNAHRGDKSPETAALSNLWASVSKNVRQAHSINF